MSTAGADGGGPPRGAVGRKRATEVYSSALAYELTSQLRSIGSCCGVTHSIADSSFEIARQDSTAPPRIIAGPEGMVPIWSLGQRRARGQRQAEPRTAGRAGKGTTSGSRHGSSGTPGMALEMGLFASRRGSTFLCEFARFLLTRWKTGLLCGAKWLEVGRSRGK